MSPIGINGVSSSSFSRAVTCSTFASTTFLQDASSAAGLSLISWICRQSDLGAFANFHAGHEHAYAPSCLTLTLHVPPFEAGTSHCFTHRWLPRICLLN